MLLAYFSSPFLHHWGKWWKQSYTTVKHLHFLISPMFFNQGYIFLVILWSHQKEVSSEEAFRLFKHEDGSSLM